MVGSCQRSKLGHLSKFDAFISRKSYDIKLFVNCSNVFLCRTRAFFNVDIDVMGTVAVWALAPLDIPAPDRPLRCAA